MECYYCSSQVKGQCLECGRFVCKNDLMIYKNKINCLHCYSLKNVITSPYTKAIEELNLKKTGTCIVCKKTLVKTLFLPKLLEMALNEEEKEKIKKEFSTQRKIFCGCVTCIVHRTTTNTSKRSNRSNRTVITKVTKCSLCGKEYTSQTYLD